MTSPEYPPIVRHEALAPLSRDHYAGLVQAQHLIKAGDTAKSLSVDRRQAVAEFLDSWQREIQPHFDDEEKLLDGLMSDADQKQFLSEHQQLRTLALQLKALRKEIDPDPEKLTELGHLLNSHIRWEERHLFNQLQQSLTKTQLKELQQRTEVLEQSRPRNICRDKG